MDKQTHSVNGFIIPLRRLLRHGPQRWLNRCRQGAQRLRADQGGQTIVLVGLILFTLALFFVLVVNTGHEVTKRFFIQNNADAAALTGASWQARILNVISLINIVMAIILGIIIILNAILKALEIATYVLLGIMIGLQICCAIPYTAAGCCPGVAGATSAYNAVKEVYDAYKEIAQPIMDALWDVLDVLSDTEDVIVDVSPYIPPLMANVVAYENAKFEDPNISAISFDVNDFSNSIGDFDMNSLETLSIGSLVVSWPLFPELPLKEGGLEDVCREVRQYVKGHWVDPLKKYGIGYILDPIIDASISVTCEGGSGSYNIQSSEMIAAGCTPASVTTPGAPDCQSIYNGSVQNASVTSIKWVRQITYFECTTKCTTCPCGNCNHEYSSTNFQPVEDEVTINSIPPVSGASYFQDGPGKACGWEKWSSRKDKIGDDDHDGAWNEDPRNGIDDDGDGLTDEDYIVYLCKHERYTMTECHYQKSGNMSQPPGTSENSDKVQPYILKDDWQKKNAVFYFTHFKKGKVPLLSSKFKSPVREKIGSNAFASSTFFCDAENIADCDMFHVNWRSKLVPVRTDSSTSSWPSFIQDAMDTVIAH